MKTTSWKYAMLSAILLLAVSVFIACDDSPQAQNTENTLGTDVDMFTGYWKDRTSNEIMNIGFNGSNLTIDYQANDTARKQRLTIVRLNGDTVVTRFGADTKEYTLVAQQASILCINPGNIRQQYSQAAEPANVEVQRRDPLDNGDEHYDGDGHDHSHRETGGESGGESGTQGGRSH
jgi:hypothetical protein